VGFWRKAVTKVAKGALDATGRAIKGALFGAEEPAPKAEEKPDPFAKLKAAEKAEKENRQGAKNAK
jgi:hypothetical protein